MSKSIQKYEEPETGIQVSTPDPRAVAVEAREKALVFGMFEIALKLGRNEYDVRNKLLDAMTRPAMAEKASYSFPRGGSTVTGASINLTREAARQWGHIRYGLNLLGQTPDEIHIQGWAHDLLSNNYREADQKIKNSIQKKVGKPPNVTTIWVEPDERDRLELVNRIGAKLVRNCLLQLLPPDMIEDALAVATETKRKAAKGDLKKSRPEIIKNIVQAFSRFTVSVEMIETKLGHNVDLMDDSELAELRSILVTLKDGIARREEYFTLPRPAAANMNLDDLTPATASAPNVEQKSAPANDADIDAEIDSDLFGSEA